MFEFIIVVVIYLAGIGTAVLIIKNNPGIIGITIEKLQAVKNAVKKV